MEVNSEGCTALHIAAQEGREADVRALLEGVAVMDKEDINGCTPLLVASRAGHEKIVVLLLKAGASIDHARHVDGATSIQMAAQNGHEAVVSELLKARAAVDQADNDGISALCIATQQGHETVVGVLLKGGAAVDQTTNGGYTPLYIAAAYGHHVAVGMLLEAGAAVNQTVEDGTTPLCIAAEQAHELVVIMLLRAGAAVDQANTDGFTPLCIAAQCGHDEIVQALLHAGADTSIQVHDRDTGHMHSALALAKQNGHAAVVQQFAPRVSLSEALARNAAARRLWWAERPKSCLKRSSHIPKTEERGLTRGQLDSFGCFARVSLTEHELFDTAAPEQSQLSGQRVSFDVANMYHLCELFIKPFTEESSCSFVELVAPAPQPPQWFLSHAWATVFKDTLSMVEWHQQCRGLQEESTIWICTFANNQHDLGELQESDLMMTPFAKAIALPQCVGVLSALDNNCTPLMRAWCVLELHTGGRLKKPLDIATMIAPKSQGFTDGVTGQVCDVQPGPVLHLSLGDGKTEEHAQPYMGTMPGTLIARGTEVKVREAQATHAGDRTNILRLIGGQGDEREARLDAFDHSVREMFYGAALRGYALQGNEMQVRELLRKAPDKLHDADADLQTGLHLAAAEGHTVLVDILLKACAVVDQQRKDGGTPLYMAAQRAQEVVVRMLLQADAAVDQADNDGVTPLYMAAQEGHQAIVDILLQAGAAVDQADNDGVTPLYTATQHGWEAIVALLIDAGADRTIQVHGYTAHALAEHCGYLPIASLLQI